MSGDQVFRIVKKYIDRMDYYGLLEGGAPKNEFDHESREISRRISDDLSAPEIAEVMAEVFNFCFNEQHSAVDFLPTAERIEKALCRKNWLISKR